MPWASGSSARFGSGGNRRGQDARHDLGVAHPGRGLGSQVRLTGFGEPVVAGALIVLGHPPCRLGEAACLEAVQRLVEGAVLHSELAARAVLEPGSDLEAVHGRPGERLQHQRVEGASHQGEWTGHAASSSAGKWFQVVSTESVGYIRSGRMAVKEILPAAVSRHAHHPPVSSDRHSTPRKGWAAGVTSYEIVITTESPAAAAAAMNVRRSSNAPSRKPSSWSASSGRFQVASR